MFPFFRLFVLVCFACSFLVRSSHAEVPRDLVQREANPPNVLFISIDDLRPEMGCYGNAIIQTPNMDRLAARGMVFNLAYCQQAVCSPSRSSIMTGRRPDATLVYDLETHFRAALPDAVTLPEHFKNHGYRCLALNKIYHNGIEDGRSWSEPHWYPRGTTVDTDPVDWNQRIVKKFSPAVTEYTQQAEALKNSNPSNASRLAKKKSVKGPAFEISPKRDDELPDGFTAKEAVARLHELKNDGKPFFLAVGFSKPHLPFVAPKKYWDLYNPDQIPTPAFGQLPDGAPEFVGHTNGELHAYAQVPSKDPLPDDFARKLRHGYYACVSYVDAQVGRLLDALEQEGLADNTVIVLWGDHGWQLGDHGLWHKHTNFELATRSPLLISVPGAKTMGQKCNQPVEFVDVYPTLADVCGLPLTEDLDGVSLKRCIDDAYASVKPVAISQYPRSDGKRRLMGYSIRDTRWRLTLWRDRASNDIPFIELYDELNDPAETKNLAKQPEHSAVIAQLSKHLPPPAVFPIPVAKRGSSSTASSSTATPSATDAERSAGFDKKDKNQDGKLTLEEFAAGQKDMDLAKTRFSRRDQGSKGYLTKEEYITLTVKK